MIKHIEFHIFTLMIKKWKYDKNGSETCFNYLQKAYL